MHHAGRNNQETSRAYLMPNIAYMINGALAHDTRYFLKGVLGGFSFSPEWHSFRQSRVSLCPVPIPKAPDFLRRAEATTHMRDRRHLVPIRLTNMPLWLYFRSVSSSEKSVKL